MSHPSNPYGPPQPAPAQPTPAPQPYPYPTPGQVWSQPGMPPYGAPPRQRNGLAIAAIAISVLSLLASLGVVAFIAVSSAAGPSWVLQGEVRPSGSAVSAGELESALTQLVEDDGGAVDEITCPGSSAVGQGLVAVCHGSVDGFDWTGLVVFEDESGTFTVNQL
jgi:hypothetical protein